FDWSYGCSATSAAMLFVYYDRTGYGNMYSGSTNGGVCPLDNSMWGETVYPSVTCHECPLSATHKGIDGRTSMGHVDDYWIDYQNAGPDPYVSNWIEHTQGNCTGDYMGTNQSKFNNKDGGTSFYFGDEGEPLYNYLAPSGKRDGCYGMRLFAESRGYTVVANYSQCIYGYEGNTRGFTYNQFKSEIDAGRPVLIQLDGHTMLGYGYNTTGNVVYIHDTWDHNAHEMTWGGSYSGMEHYGVTVLQLAINTTTMVTSSSSTSTYGDPVTFTATVTGTSGITPSGTITFRDGTNDIGTSVLNGSGNTATTIYITTAGQLAAGSLSIFAVYSGDSNFSPSTSTAITLTVSKRTLTITATGVNKIYDGTTAATVTFTDNRITGDILTIGYNAVFNSRNVGIGKTVNVSGISISGIDSGNYTNNTTATTTANVTTKVLIVIATGINKVYDGTVATTVTLADNRVSGDILITNYTSTSFSNKNVGIGKTVNVSGISISGTDSSNYTNNTTATTTANVTTKVLTVTATGVNRVYDGTTAASVILADNRISGDVLTTSYNAVFNNKNIGTGKTVNVSSILISGTDSGNYTNNTTATTIADITAKLLTVTATGINRVYDGTTAASVALADDRVSGDVLTTSYTLASFSNQNAGTGKTVNVSGISISGTDSGNYTNNTITTTNAGITAKAITVMAEAKTRIYGDNDPVLTYINSPALIAGDSFSGNLTRAAGEDTGTYSITQGELILNSNYTLTYGGANLTITPRPIVVRAEMKYRVFGEADPALTYNIMEGKLIGSDNMTGSMVREAGDEAGSYIINQGTLTAGSNYILAFISGNFIILESEMDQETLFVAEFNNQEPTPVDATQKASVSVSFIDTGAVTGSVDIVKFNEEPVVPTIGFSIPEAKGGTGRVAVKYIDVRVNGFSTGIAQISVHYTDEEIAGLAEKNISLYYWDSNKWQQAADCSVDMVKKVVTGNIVVAALSGTPIALGAVHLRNWILIGGVAGGVLAVIVVVILFIVSARRKRAGA
ncbi:MAG: YDG domain-containing protein, partial [Chloroflexi bacterium]|nr:YDG domain-containing protein [Chloroflexota bacterium]